MDRQVIGIIICCLFICAVLFVNVRKMLLKCGFRGILGTICIYGLTLLMGVFNMPAAVGINALSFGICAVFGMPGVVLLYGLMLIGQYC